MSNKYEMERYGSGAGPKLEGKLIKYTGYGCYPVYYLDGGGCTLCSDCANESDSLDDGDADKAVIQDVNWEDPDLYCDACSKRIESAYAEKE
jgi:hypothetical protein